MEQICTEDHAPTPRGPSPEVLAGPTAVQIPESAPPTARSAVGSLYERSPWAYVFEHVCHEASTYTASQRLVLLAVAKHMGTRIDGRPVCFVSYRTLCEETGLKRTAVKGAVKAVRSAQPTILKMERPPRGNRMQTNGVLHACYRFTLLPVPVPALEGQRRDQRRKYPKADDTDGIARRMQQARDAHLMELTAIGLPRVVADWISSISAEYDRARWYVEQYSRPADRRDMLRQLVKSDFRQCVMGGKVWGLRYYGDHLILDDADLDVARAERKLLQGHTEGESQRGSATDTGGSREPTT